MVALADVLIVIVNGLRRFPEAINVVFPEISVQNCISNLISNSMGFASRKDRKAIAGALRSFYRAENTEAGLAAKETLEAGPWGRNHPAIAQT